MELVRCEEFKATNHVLRGDRKCVYSYVKCRVYYYYVCRQICTQECYSSIIGQKNMIILKLLLASVVL